MIYFTSDHHFGHSRIIGYCNRPFRFVQEMDRAMEENWNSVVSKDDKVYVLGDFSFDKPERTNQILNRLNGYKILLVGNHDKKYTEWKFDEFITGNSTFDLDGLPVLLSHYPYPPSAEDLILNPYDVKFMERRYEDRGQILLHGHVHQIWKSKKTDKGSLMINVGVDVHGFLPINLEQIKEIINENIPS